MAPTKEAKQALKEAKLAAKLAAELEARKKLKREELQRELAAQAKKRGDIDRTWRELMLKIKEPVFKQDIEVMWHTFDRSLDKKDSIINYTMKLMDIADDQFQRTTASFCVTIDKMVNKFLDDLDDMSRDNVNKTAKLLEAGKNDAKRIMMDHNTAETHLQLMLYHGNTTADSLNWTTRGENFVKQGEDCSKYANERECLRSLLEDDYNYTWDEYKSVLKKYVTETADNQKQVRKLRFKENLMADIIASQGKKIANSGGMLKRLRTELAAYESGTKQAVFRDRRNRHRAACSKLKKRLINGCALDINQLTLLVSASDSTIDWLDNAAKKGEKILRIAALCRKLESLREKIMPYGSTGPHVPSLEKSNLRENRLVSNAMSLPCGLTKLWQRIAKAELTKRALHREKMLLIQENSYIGHQIDECKTDTILPDSQKCRCAHSISKKSVNPPTAIEGVLELRKYR